MHAIRFVNLRRKYVESKHNLFNQQILLSVDLQSICEVYHKIKI